MLLVAATLLQQPSPPPHRWQRRWVKVNATAITYYKDEKCDKKAGETIAVLPGMSARLVAPDEAVHVNAFEKPGAGKTAEPVGREHVVALFAPPKQDPSVSFTRRMSLGANASDRAVAEAPVSMAGARTFYFQTESAEAAQALADAINSNVTAYMASPAARDRLVRMAASHLAAAGIDTSAVDVAAALDGLFAPTSEDSGTLSEPPSQGLGPAKPGNPFA